MAVNASLLSIYLSLSSFLHPSTPTILFNLTSFPPATPNIAFSGDASTAGDNTIHLTRTGGLHSAGRATYVSPIKLWDTATGAAADFSTQFDFAIDSGGSPLRGDGLAFFLAPVGSDLPLNSSGGWLGLFNSSTAAAATTKLLAVEVDTFQNAGDPSSHHLGIDVNSIVSVITQNCNPEIMNGSRVSAIIGYDSAAKSFYASLTYNGDRSMRVYRIAYTVDLPEILPDKVVVGFSASTGSATEAHRILSWSLVSTMGLADGATRASGE